VGHVAAVDELGDVAVAIRETDQIPVGVVTVTDAIAVGVDDGDDAALPNRVDGDGRAAA
jgi:hypothetical protein